MNLVYFGMSAALGIIGWSVIFAALIWPKIKHQPRVWRLKILTALHFFSYTGTMVLMVGLVSSKLPVAFTNPAAFGDVIALVLAYIAFIALQRSKNDDSRLTSVWLFNIVGAGELLLAVVLGPLFIKDPTNFGFAYFMPVFYVPMRLVAHFYSFRVLRENAR